MSRREQFWLPGRELRVQGEGGSRSVSGLIPYGSPSSGLPWIETISPGAFSSALEPDAEVLLLRQHDVGQLFGNTRAKTLILTDTPSGLAFRCQLPNTSQAADLIESMSRKDLDGVSFGMIVNQCDWGEDGKGNVTRNITNLDLFEISIVNWAVFSGASASLRSVPKALRSLLKRSNERGCECSCTSCSQGDCGSCEGDDNDGECDDEACASHGCPLQDEDDEDRATCLSWSERTLLRLEVMKRL